MTTEKALNVVISETDAGEQAKPEFIPLVDTNIAQINQAIMTIQQAQAGLEIAQDRLQAAMWRCAEGLGIDLGGYQFDFQRQGFVKK